MVKAIDRDGALEAMASLEYRVEGLWETEGVLKQT